MKKDKISKLEALSELLKNGSIDDIEFEKLKKDILTGNDESEVNLDKDLKTSNQVSDEEKIDSLNIFDQFITILINAPHKLLISIAPYMLFWTYYGTCCCLNPLAGYDMRNDLSGFLTNSDNFLYIIIVIIPFIIGVILAIRIIFQMIFNVNYPNGDNPYGFVPLISLFIFSVAAYLYLVSLGFING